MTNQKRFVLFCIIVFGWMLASSYISRMMGWVPPPKKPLPIPAAAQQAKEEKLDLARGEGAADEGGAKPARPLAEESPKQVAKAAISASPLQSEVDLLEPSELVLGSLTDKSPG